MCINIRFSASISRIKNISLAFFNKVNATIHPNTTLSGLSKTNRSNLVQATRKSTPRKLSVSIDLQNKLLCPHIKPDARFSIPPASGTGGAPYKTQVQQFVNARRVNMRELRIFIHPEFSLGCARETIKVRPKCRPACNFTGGGGGRGRGNSDGKHLTRQSVAEAAVARERKRKLGRSLSVYFMGPAGRGEF